MIGDCARISVSIAVPPALAFELFTAQIDRWWRRGPKFRSRAGAGFIHIEPHVGGRLFESVDGADGAVFEVGRVRIWDPPRHLAFTWRAANFAEHEESEGRGRIHGRRQARWSLSHTAAGRVCTTDTRPATAYRKRHSAA
jgi:uncharacterized protein YndB with AHSA1/START domain